MRVNTTAVTVGIYIPNTVTAVNICLNLFVFLHKCMLLYRNAESGIAIINK